MIFLSQFSFLPYSCVIYSKNKNWVSKYNLRINWPRSSVVRANEGSIPTRIKIIFRFLRCDFHWDCLQTCIFKTPLQTDKPEMFFCRIFWVESSQSPLAEEQESSEKCLNFKVRANPVGKEQTCCTYLIVILGWLPSSDSKFIKISKIVCDQ